ncbi:MAG: peptidylprolyl isomerase [Spirochaetes bacterium]|nr:peptidylprolyl isomerase [Spirochaetota bacterium]
MNEMIKKILFLIIIANTFFLYSQTLLFNKRAARVADQVILKSTVKKHAELYQISYDQAFEHLLEEELLYVGATIYIDEPTIEDIENQVTKEKKILSLKYKGKNQDLSDEEFISIILNNNLSMTTYKANIKKSLWIERFLNDHYDRGPNASLFISDEDITRTLEKFPELGYEKEGVELSMIYFSFYNANGNRIGEYEEEKKRLQASVCLEDLKKGVPFDELVPRYSDDLISLNSNPPGFVGILTLDDPRVTEKFSEEIVTALKNSKGLIKKVFETVYGLYIFQVLSKIEPQQLSVEEARMKAEDFMLKLQEIQRKRQIRTDLVKDLKDKIEIKIY